MEYTEYVIKFMCGHLKTLLSIFLNVIFLCTWKCKIANSYNLPMRRLFV